MPHAICISGTQKSVYTIWGCFGKLIRHICRWKMFNPVLPDKEKLLRDPNDVRTGAFLLICSGSVFLRDRVGLFSCAQYGQNCLDDSDYDHKECPAVRKDHCVLHVLREQECDDSADTRD